MNRYVDDLNFADVFVLFFALLGPQKILLAVARMARTRDPRDVRLAVTYASGVAACVGVACALTAPWIATFFHISTGSVELAGGLLFFTFAVGMVFGFHFGESGPRDDTGGEDAGNPVGSGFRELLLPFVVSPLGVAAALEGSLEAHNWTERWFVACAYVTVVVIDLISSVMLAPLMRRAQETALEVLSRLLGILLAAVGVALFLQGLSMLGVHFPAGH